MRIEQLDEGVRFGRREINKVLSDNSIRVGYEFEFHVNPEELYGKSFKKIPLSVIEETDDFKEEAKEVQKRILKDYLYHNTTTPAFEEDFAAVLEQVSYYDDFWYNFLNDEDYKQSISDIIPYTKIPKALLKDFYNQLKFIKDFEGDLVDPFEFTTKCYIISDNIIRIKSDNEIVLVADVLGKLGIPVISANKRFNEIFETISTLLDSAEGSEIEYPNALEDLTDVNDLLKVGFHKVNKRTLFLSIIEAHGYDYDPKKSLSPESYREFVKSGIENGANTETLYNYLIKKFSRQSVVVLSDDGDPVAIKSDNDDMMDDLVSKSASLTYDVYRKLKDENKLDLHNILDIAVDGSVSVGVEIITEPLLPKEAREYVTGINEFIKKYGHTSEATGLHINISTRSTQTRKINYGKLVLLTDEKLTKQFFGKRNFVDSVYKKSALAAEFYVIFNNYFKNKFPKNIAKALDEAFNKHLLHKEKYVTINVKNLFEDANQEKRVEFRFPGGRGYESRSETILWFTYRLAYLTELAFTDEYNTEYYKKLYRFAMNLVKEEFSDISIEWLQ